MSILKKLGITESPWKGAFDLIIDKSGKETLFKADDDCTLQDFKLAKTSPEMLEALIELTIETINSKIEFYGSLKTSDEITKCYQETIYIIEKATGKSWNEIQELI